MTTQETTTEKTRKAFNVRTQQEEDAVVTIDANGEYLFTFAGGSFIKFPADFQATDIDEHLALHEEENKGQVKAEDVALADEAKLANI